MGGLPISRIIIPTHSSTEYRRYEENDEMIHIESSTVSPEFRTNRCGVVRSEGQRLTVEGPLRCMDVQSLRRYSVLKMVSESCSRGVIGHRRSHPRRSNPIEVIGGQQNTMA